MQRAAVGIISSGGKTCVKQKEGNGSQLDRYRLIRNLHNLLKKTRAFFPMQSRTPHRTVPYVRTVPYATVQIDNVCKVAA